MYRINGVDLDNPTHGWICRPGTKPYSAITRPIDGVESRGRNGYAPIAATDSPTIWPFQFNTPPSGWEALQALMRQPLLTLTRTDRAGISAIGRVPSSSIDRVFARNEWIDVTYYVELYDPFWRDTAASTTTPASLSPGATTMNFWPGMSAPVQDAIVRVKGPATGLRVNDSGGSWVALPDVASNEWVRFESETGHCFRTTSDTWTGGTNISGLVDFGGPHGIFEITEKVTNLTARTASISVSAASAVGATAQVRGKAAYAL